jgi:flagellar biosynthesis anti-sigma factor FlgM
MAMAMEINYTNNLTSIGRGCQSVEKWISEKGRQAGADAAGFDRVDLSNNVRGISLFNNMINAVPDVRESRVEEVLLAIESGTYDVNAEQVAEKIIGGDLLNEII